MANVNQHADMNCKKYETMIYLKDELSDLELQSLEKHLKTCASCALLSSEVMLFQERISSVAQSELQPANAAKLTSSIMAAIQNEKRSETLLDQIKRWLQEYPLRYSLATVSLGLIIFFGVEFFNHPNQVPHPVQQHYQAEVILSADMLQDKSGTTKQRKSGFAACKSPYISTLAYIECLKNKHTSI
jgi:ABC-type uncharacterized transport system permease subunit